MCPANSPHTSSNKHTPRIAIKVILNKMPASASEILARSSRTTLIPCLLTKEGPGCGPGSRICDHVPLRNAVLENKRGGLHSVEATLAYSGSFEATRLVCLDGALARPITISVPRLHIGAVVLADDDSCACSHSETAKKILLECPKGNLFYAHARKRWIAKAGGRSRLA